MGDFTLSDGTESGLAGAMADGSLSDGTYSYDADDTEKNVIQLYSTDELIKDSSVDPLRKELGFTYSKIKFVGLDGSEGVEFQAGTGVCHIEKEALRDYNFVKMSTNSKYIDWIEIMPSRIVPINSTSMFPNYKIPVRMYANEANTSNDELWRTLFTGGTYGEAEFPRLIDEDNIFNDYSFTYANSYTTLYAKSIGINDSCKNKNLIQASYNSYSLDVRDHQIWEAKQESPLAIPNYYILQTICAAAAIFDASEMSESIWRPSLSSPIRQISPSLQVRSALIANNELSGTLYEPTHEALMKIGTDLSNEDTAKSYFQSVYLPQLRATVFPESQVRDSIKSQKNIIMSDGHFNAGTLETAPFISPNIFPYYNIISWPRHVEAAVPAPITMGCSYDGLHQEEMFIRNSIAENDFSAKFLETLKDIHHGEFSGLSYGNKNLHVEFSGRQLTDAADYGTHTQRTVIQRKYRTLDLTKMLQMMYNNPDEALNDNYTFVGPPDPSYQSTYKDNKLYRYYDNKNLIGGLDIIYEKLRKVYDLPQDARDWDATMGGATAGTYGHEWMAPETTTTLENTRDILNFIFNPNLCHAETIAYRIEKTGGSSSGDYSTPEVLQEYWIFNSAHAPADLSIYDTQVKYGKNYTYRVYAYVAVVGKRYMYSDFRVTKQIGQLDSGPDGGGDGAHDLAPVAPDGDPEYYCVQFYEPISGEYADQLFNLGKDNWTVGELDTPIYLNYDGQTHSTLRGSTETSALSQRNEFASDQVDLTESPHLADFHLNIEPCVKLVEIPLFKKKLKVLDSPANDMVTIPFQYMDASKQIGFNMRYENFNHRRPYPVSLAKADIRNSTDYQYSRNLIPGSDIIESAKAPQRYIEVYRTDTRPTSFSDFRNKLVDTIDLQIEDSNYNFSDTFYRTKIPTNKKYYFVFRFVTENLVPGHMSQILQCELLDDGDYIYSKFEVLADQLSAEETLKKTSKTCKKMFQIEPNISQTALNTTSVNFLNTATTEIENLNIGESDTELIWDQTFKVRLTSKKTSKQIDFNITFKLQDINRINMERGDNLIHGKKLDPGAWAAKFDYLAGTTAGGAGFSSRPGFETYYVSTTGDDLDFDPASVIWMTAD